MMTVRVFIVFCLFVAPVSASQLFDIAGSGTNWTGWEYCDGTVSGCVSYSKTGWKKNDYVIIDNKPVPRSFEKDDYGNETRAEIVSYGPVHDPTGSTLHLYDSGTGTQFRSAWWLWEGVDTMGNMGIASTSSDRFSMYVRLNGVPALPDVGSLTDNLELGTYTCWDGGGAYGENCPTESDNGHWYHKVAVQPDLWVHMLWDEHPTTRRNVSTTYQPDNPTLSFYGKDYYEHLYMMYIQHAIYGGVATSDNDIWIYKPTFMTASDFGEANQNDISISSLWVGYDPSDSHWEIGWMDVSTLPGETHDSEYEIRWSPSPITNANFSAATIVQPQRHVINGNHIHKPSNSYRNLWTTFDLPAGAESNIKLYFAVKDVSVAGGDFNDAPSPNIHTIDYALSAALTTTYYLDADGDGYSPGTSQQSATAPGATWYTAVQLTATSGDCDDSNPAIHPGATDIPGNSIDEDCSGSDTMVLPSARGLKIKAGQTQVQVGQTQVTAQ